MLNINNQAAHLKREILVRIAKLLDRAQKMNQYYERVCAQG